METRLVKNPTLHISTNNIKYNGGRMMNLVCFAATEPGNPGVNLELLHILKYFRVKYQVQRFTSLNITKIEHAI